MRVTVERAALLRSLGHVHRVVERRNTIPILSNVLIGASDDAIRVVATDLDIQFTSLVPAEVEVPGAFTVPAKTLTDLAKRMPAGARITFEQATESGQVTVKAGRSRASLFSLPASDFPNLTDGEFPDSFEIVAEDFGGLLAKTAFAISTEETRYYLNGTYLVAHEVAGVRTLRGVATDGHRLARVDTTKAIGLDRDFAGVIVPRKSVSEVIRLCEGIGKGTVSVAVSRSKLRLTAGDTTFVTKLIDGTFPDYERVIPAANPRFARIAVTDLSQALERLKTLASEDQHAVIFMFEENTLRLELRSPDNGTISDEVDAEYANDPLTIGFSAEYVLDQLRGIDTDTVVIRLGDPGSPALFIEKDGAPALFVLMPKRV